MQPEGWTPPPAAGTRRLCTDCGVSRSSEPSRCARACQFIQPDYPTAEIRVHGRARDPARPDELHFGPFVQMLRARLQPAREGAQWTGITTRLAEVLLERGLVDGVLATASDPEDRWRPRPLLATKPEELAACRGMKMGYAPLLALLEPARAQDLKRLAVIGIPCQIYALRALEAELGFEQLLVIGTPCSDNTHTERFHEFLGLLSSEPQTIRYLEFRADYRVELRFDNGRQQTIPFLQLPLAKLPKDFFPLTCSTCVDYTNALADITVGYMGGDGEQWLIVRNQRGARMLALLGDELQTKPVGSAGRRAAAVKGFVANARLAAGGLPLKRTPKRLRPLVSWLMPRIGPRGLEFARARVEMKAAETILQLEQRSPRKLRSMVPGHVWALAAPYGVGHGAAESTRTKPMKDHPLLATLPWAQTLALCISLAAGVVGGAYSFDFGLRAGGGLPLGVLAALNGALMCSLLSAAGIDWIRVRLRGAAARP